MNEPDQSAIHDQFEGQKLLILSGPFSFTGTLKQFYNELFYLTKVSYSEGAYVTSMETCQIPFASVNAFWVTK